MGSYWSPEKFSAMRPYYHCITPLYILISVIAFMCGARHIRLILSQVEQNKAMRIINGVPPRTNLDNFYIENIILTVKHIYDYNIGLFMYKYVNKMTPDVFDNFFSSTSDIHQHDTRNATMKLHYITFRGTTRGLKTFKFCGPRIWNFIIKYINPNCPISSFKTNSCQRITLKKP